MPVWKAHRRLEYFLLLRGVLKRNGFLFSSHQYLKTFFPKTKGGKNPNIRRKENLLPIFKKRKQSLKLKAKYVRGTHI